MELRIAALADYSNVTREGKLNILGIFSQIHAAQAPAQHLQMQLVLQFAFDPSEARDQQLAIVLQDADGQEVLRIGGMLPVPKTPGADPIIVNQIAVLNNVVFPHYGNYEFVVEVNGEPLPTRVPVDVILTPAALTPHP